MHDGPRQGSREEGQIGRVSPLPSVPPDRSRRANRRTIQGRCEAESVIIDVRHGPASADASREEGRCCEC